MKYRYYLGIDPGKTGAAVLIDSVFGIIKTIRFKKYEGADLSRKLADFCKLPNVFGVIEKVHAIGKSSKDGQQQHKAQNMFTFGGEYVRVQTVLDLTKIPYRLVPPVTWKRHFKLIKTEKKDARLLANKLIPYTKITYDVGDAALLALYAQYLGEKNNEC